MSIFKKLIAFSFLIFFPFLSFADSLTCQTGFNGGFLVFEKIYAECNDGYSISIEGLGASYPFRFAKESIEIGCPFQSEIAGTYFGVKASAGLLLHASGALFVGEGFCFVGGLGLGGGTSASLTLLAIERGGVLFNAIRTVNIEKLERQLNLLKDAENIKDLKGNTPLLVAAFSSGSILNRIIEWEKSRLNNPSEWQLYINTPNESGVTALMRIALFGHEDILRLLIEEGADVNHEINLDDDYSGGETAIMWAVEGGRENVLKLLIEGGADVNHKNKFGKTALMYAAESGYVNLMKVLIDNGAEVNAIENDRRLTSRLIRAGETALMKAAKYGSDGAVQLLIDSGADVNMKTSEGMTALSYARNDYIEKIIKDAGGHY